MKKVYVVERKKEREKTASVAILISVFSAEFNSQVIEFFFS